VTDFLPSVPEPGPGPDPGADGPDPELLALPRPPKGRRFLAMTSMGAVVLAALALLLHVRKDAAYRFADARPTELGDVTAVELSALESNRYVRVRGTPMLSRMVRFERSLSGQRYAVFPLAGQRQIFVQVPLDALEDPARAAQGEFRGRLLTFGELGGRFRSVRLYLARQMDLPVTAESFVVLAEEPPSSYSWAVGLCALCIAIIALMGALFLRWFRPLAAGSRTPVRATVE
jgi:hypothetical protein